jgi:undecaprenyl diphosphate synthase
MPASRRHATGPGLLAQVEENRRAGRSLPAHVAIIMDGNGRWARQRSLPRIQGHRAGIGSVRRIVTEGARLGLTALTLYAFSMENWQRPAKEVSRLMGYLSTYLRKERPLMMRNNIRLRGIGKLDLLHPDVLSSLRETERLTSGNTGMTLVLALSYGSRTDLVEACRSIAAKAAGGTLDPASISTETIDGALSTAGLPPVDLLIRTSGEQRISNFLLWESAYAELHFTPVLWPDFAEEELLEAILDFQGRSRRFGLVEGDDDD